MKKFKKGNCECCGRELKFKMSTQKFCSNCSLYIKKIRMERGMFKAQLRKANNKIWKLQLILNNEDKK